MSIISVFQSPKRSKSMVQDVELVDNETIVVDTTIVKLRALSCPDLSMLISLSKDSGKVNGLGNSQLRNKVREENRTENQTRKLFECLDKSNLAGMVEAVALGASVFTVDIANGETALHKSVAAVSLFQFEIFGSFVLVLFNFKAFSDGTEYLLQNGAVVNLQDFKGRTPLHVACLKCFTGYSPDRFVSNSS